MPSLINEYKHQLSNRTGLYTLFASNNCDSILTADLTEHLIVSPTCSQLEHFNTWVMTGCYNFWHKMVTILKYSNTWL
jgi:hypothetical protein